MKRILIVEDDKELCNELKTLLERNGYEADYLDSFNHACEDIIKYNPDIVKFNFNSVIMD